MVLRTFYVLLFLPWSAWSPRPAAICQSPLIEDKGSCVPVVCRVALSHSALAHRGPRALCSQRLRFWTTTTRHAIAQAVRVHLALQRCYRAGQEAARQQQQHFLALGASVARLVPGAPRKSRFTSVCFG